MFESVSRAGLESLVLYADSETQVDALTTYLANEMTTHAVIVAGDCNAAVRERLRDRLSGSKKRVRIIAIAPSDTDSDEACCDDAKCCTTATDGTHTCTMKHADGTDCAGSSCCKGKSCEAKKTS